MPQESTTHGTTTSGNRQASLSSVAGRQIADYVTDDRRIRSPIRCPDCGADVTASKGGVPLPDDAPARTTHGWECGVCETTFPANCVGPAAPHYTERMVGIEVTFRDGTERYVPVPATQVDRDGPSGA